jgi:phosphate acetyltransferase
MAKNIMLVPTQAKVGLISVSMGVGRVLESRGINFNFFNPIYTNDDDRRESKLVAGNAHELYGIDFAKLEALISSNDLSVVLENLSAAYAKLSKNVAVVLIKGLSPNPNHPYLERLNAAIAEAFNAEIIFVTTPGVEPSSMGDSLEIAAQPYGGVGNKKVIGCIVNKINAPLDDDGVARLDFEEDHVADDMALQQVKDLKIFKSNDFKLFGSILWDKKLYAPRVSDIIGSLDTTIISAGEIASRRIYNIKLCARMVNNLLNVLKPNTLLVTAGDRADVIIATSVAELKGVKISGIILTGSYDINKDVLDFCAPALELGLPILSVKTDSFETATILKHLNTVIPLDDHERIERVRDVMAANINFDDVIANINSDPDEYITPPAFRYQLLEKSRSVQKRIVLPEGDEIRTIEAAVRCVEQGIAQCVLLADKDKVEYMAQQHGIALPDNLEIINPLDVRDNYIAPLCDLRRQRGMTEAIAKEQLQDNVMLGTMMLHLGEVDGLVSGAVNTTANTIRPALQIIKTNAQCSKVSSLFFMCMPKSVLVFADCAVNPDPNAEELADIAIVTAETAKKFGIEPRVAMLSYSTGNSASGSDVEKIIAATNLVKQRKPDLIIDGPLQYDAALIPSVGRQKAPGSPVAGNASVLIFPDLNTGNTTYKAVQRSADIMCIGPVLLGLNKPVNDLSRGALVKDIIFTIAITAIQAQD